LPHFFSLTVSDVLAIKLFIVMLPYMVCINVGAVLMAILNSLKHFAVPAFAPVILNLTLIGACYFALPYFGTMPEQQIWALAAAVLAGGLLQLFIQLPPLLSRGFKPQFTMDKNDAGYREVMGNFLPVVLLVAVFQANVLIDNIIAAIFIPGEGSVTYLNMGTSVYHLPWSIFSLALGTAALPALSELWAKNKREEFNKTLLTALRMIIFLALPCTVGIMLLSEDIVRLLYGAGKFLDNDGEPIRRTASVVMFSSLGLVFYSLNSVLARALYAMKDMKTPTTTSAKSVGINLVLNIAFVTLTDMKEGGIALASTVSNAWQTWALIRALQARASGDAAPKFSIPPGLMSIAGAAAIATAIGFLGFNRAGQVWRAVGFSGEVEGFVPMLLAAVGSLATFWILNNQYFAAKLKEKPHDKDLTLRMGVREEHWDDWLKFEFALYTTIYATAVMGFAVWAVRDSVPPEGRTLLLVVQRSIVPVLLGMLVFSSVCSSVLSREYEDLKAALFRRRIRNS
ncbi:MAG TPA: murein biosynthesis integral membrane protein MurJ, partial [Planctomycetota bacterium]|nr:murein biosynthesis integral membrane protein MurJ [Planctomycetota bacterium]